MSKIPPLVLKIGVGIVIVGFVFWLGWSRFAPGKEQTELATVTRQEIVQSVSETGKVTPAQSLELGFDTSGKIASFFVKDNDAVEAGAILVQLDQNELLREKERQEAALESAETSLKNVTEKAQSDLENQYASAFSSVLSSFTKADVALKTEKIIFDRYLLGSADQTVIKIKESYDLANASLAKTNLVVQAMQSENLATNIEAALSSLKNTLLSVSSSLNQMSSAASDPIYKVSSTDRDTIDNQRNTISSELSTITTVTNTLSSLKISNQIKIDEAKAAKKEAETSLALTLARLDKTRLTSPVSGTVTKIDGEIGEIAQVGKPIIYMRGLEPFEIEVEIPETDIAKVKSGAPVAITIEAINKAKEFSGRVARIEPQEINRDGDIYYKTTVSLAEKVEGLRTGMTADLEIETGRVPDALIIPRRALIRSGGEVEVLVKTDSQEEKRKVEIGIENQDSVQITSGLNEGEKVIIKKTPSR